MTSKQNINAKIKLKLYRLAQIKSGSDLTWTCRRVTVLDPTELNWLLEKMKLGDHRSSQPAPT